MKTLIGIVTFGNLPFTQLALRSLDETVCEPHKIMVIVGDPRDVETVRFLQQEGIEYLRHEENMGFPASINDLYDFGWQHHGFDNLIIMGNDVVAYPEAIDRMIRMARDAQYEWICASQFDSKSLVARYPQAARYFAGENMVFSDFAARPWELHWPAHLAENGGRLRIEDDCIKDVRNLCLFKRSVFEKIGYADVNFWPGGYYEDNDYCTRARLAGIEACGLPGALYFHFWSRTIHQGDGKSANDFYFGRNGTYYRQKWGGSFGEETTVTARPPIHDRIMEEHIIKHWRSLRG